MLTAWTAWGRSGRTLGFTQIRTSLCLLWPKRHHLISLALSIRRRGEKPPHNSSLLSCCIFLAVRYFAWRSIPGTLGGGLQMQRLLHRILFCQSWNSAGITPGGVFAKLRKFERSINADGVKRKQTWMLVPIVASS